MIRDHSDGSIKPPMQTLDALRAKYGKDWGIKGNDRTRKPPEPAPTPDELKQHYQKFNLGFRPKETA